MNRSIVSLIGLVSLSLASVACSGAAGDDLSANSAADTTESANATSDGVSHIFRAIDANTVEVVNQKTTTCADGSRAATCSVVTFDFSALGLTAAASNSLQTQFNAGSALAKGTLKMVDHAIGGGSHAIERNPTLVVTEAWLAEGDVTVGSFGQFETVTKNAANCGAIVAGSSTPACEAYSLTMLNKTDTSSAVSVDFTAASLSAAAVKKAESTLSTDGLVVFGYFQGVARGPMSFEVTSVFAPVVASN